MPTVGTGQLAGPLDTLAEMFAGSARFAADVLASGEADAADRVYQIARTEDEAATVEGSAHPYVLLWEPRGAKWDRQLGPFGPTEIEGRIEYAITEGQTEADAYKDFANAIDEIAQELYELANGSSGTLVNFSIEFEEPAMRSDPLREGDDESQFYTAAFKVRCGLEG